MPITSPTSSLTIAVRLESLCATIHRTTIQLHTNSSNYSTQVTSTYGLLAGSLGHISLLNREALAVADSSTSGGHVDYNLILSKIVMAILLLIHPITHSLTRSLTLSFFSPNKISPLHPHLLAMIPPPSIYLPNLHLHPEKKQPTSASLGRKIGLALQPLTATNEAVSNITSRQFSN